MCPDIECPDIKRPEIECINLWVRTQKTAKFVHHFCPKSINCIAYIKLLMFQNLSLQYSF